MTEKILFLDFDGVLHPSFSENFFTRKDLLWSAIQNRPPRIVVSSSWRFQHTLKKLKQLLGPDIGQYVIGATGEAFIGKYARFEEINQWIHMHNCANWIILDDSRYEFPENLPYLLLCDARIGLTQNTADQLQAWLAAKS
jgi:hypothetical protein